MAVIFIFAVWHQYLLRSFGCVGLHPQVPPLGGGGKSAYLTGSVLKRAREHLKGRAGAVWYPGPNSAPHEWLMEYVEQGKE